MVPQTVIMPEVSGTQFLKSAKNTEPETEDYRLADSENRYITLTLEPLERQHLFDELARMPDAFIEMMVVGGEETEEPLDEVEDPEDVDLDVGGGELMTNIDGNVIDVFETLFYESASHEDLTSLDLEELAPALDLEVLFDVGGRVIDISLESSGGVKRFQEPASDKNS